MTLINGENYKVRTREVNGQEQQIFYKKGQAFIKDESGELVPLRKSDDGLFKKASYETAEYQYNERVQDANKRNSQNPSGNLGNTHPCTNTAVNKRGTFKTENGGTVSGVIKQMAGSLEDSSSYNVLVNERKTAQGTRTQTFAFNEDSTVYPLETVHVQEGTGKILSQDTYDWAAKPVTRTTKRINKEGGYTVQTYQLSEITKEFKLISTETVANEEGEQTQSAFGI